MHRRVWLLMIRKINGHVIGYLDNAIIHASFAVVAVSFSLITRLFVLSHPLLQSFQNTFGRSRAGWGQVGGRHCSLMSFNNYTKQCKCSETLIHSEVGHILEACMSMYDIILIPMTYS